MATSCRAACALVYAYPRQRDEWDGQHRATTPAIAARRLAQIAFSSCGFADDAMSRVDAALAERLLGELFAVHKRVTAVRIQIGDRSWEFELPVESAN